MISIKMKNMLFIMLLCCISQLVYSKSTTFKILTEDNKKSQIIFKTKADMTHNLKNPLDALGNAMTLKNEGTAELDLENAITSQKIISIKGLTELEINPKVKANTQNINLLMDEEDSKYEIDRIKQWQLWMNDDYNGWSNSTTTKCGNRMKILGGHCAFSKTEIEKKFTNIPKHTMLKIKANFHFIDKWEGEIGYMKFNSMKVWKDTYKWCDKIMGKRCFELGLNTCGGEYPDKIGVPIEFVVPHKEDSFTLNFGSTLEKNACEASWGISNISVYIK